MYKINKAIDLDNHKVQLLNIKITENGLVSFFGKERLYEKFKIS